MRLTLTLLGHTLDLSLEPTASETEDNGAALNGGTLASIGPIVGFTVRAPEEVMPQHVPAWDEPDE